MHGFWDFNSITLGGKFHDKLSGKLSLPIRHALQSTISYMAWMKNCTQTTSFTMLYDSGIHYKDANYVMCAPIVLDIRSVPTYARVMSVLTVDMVDGRGRSVPVTRSKTYDHMNSLRYNFGFVNAFHSSSSTSFVCKCASTMHHVRIIYIYMYEFTIVPCVLLLLASSASSASPIVVVFCQAIAVTVAQLSLSVDGWLPLLKFISNRLLAVR